MKTKTTFRVEIQERAKSAEGIDVTWWKLDEFIGHEIPAHIAHGAPVKIPKRAPKGTGLADTYEAGQTLRWWRERLPRATFRIVQVTCIEICEPVTGHFPHPWRPQAS